jgi:hypothetical protein
MLKKVIFIWFFYIFAILLLTYFLNLLGLTSLQNHSPKEVLFAQWGYGWDGMHYIKIATIGYHFPLQAFFPFYPLVIKFFDLFLPLTFAYRINILLLGLCLAALYFYQKSYKGLIVFLLFPTAFFLQANYTETLFILLAGLILLSLRKGNFWFAGLLGVLLTATKVSGVSISVVIFVAYLLHFPKPKLAQLVKAVTFSLIPLLGIGLYFLYLHFAFGSLSIFFTSQAEWGRATSNISTNYLVNYFIPIWKSIVTRDISIYRRVVELFTAFFAIILLVKSYKKIPVPDWLYSFSQVAIPLATGSFLSFNRLFLLAFPLILFFSDRLRSTKSIPCYAVVAGLLQIFFIYLFLNGIFIG